MPYRCSIVIPVFNDQAALLSCMNALACQTCPADSWEVIVVDNGSTPAIDLPDFDSINLRLIQEDTPGAYAARNAAIRVSRSGILAFTDADCVPSSDWLERGVKAVEAREGRTVVGGAIEMYLRRGVPRTAAALYELHFGLRQEKYWRVDGFLVTANMFVPSGAFLSAGLFREDLYSGSDAEWCRRAAAAGYGLDFEPRVLIQHPVRWQRHALKHKIERDAQGGTKLGWIAVEYKPGRQRARRREAARMIGAVMRSKTLSGLGERVSVFFMAGLVVLWKWKAKLWFRFTGRRSR